VLHKFHWRGKWAVRQVDRPAGSWARRWTRTTRAFWRSGTSWSPGRVPNFSISGYKFLITTTCRPKSRTGSDRFRPVQRAARCQSPSRPGTCRFRLLSTDRRWKSISIEKIDIQIAWTNKEILNQGPSIDRNSWLLQKSTLFILNFKQNPNWNHISNKHLKCV